MKRSDKPKIVDELVNLTRDAKSITVVDYQKMGTKQLNELRQKVSKVGGSFVVAKNTLIELALKKAGVAKKSEIGDALVGPTALIIADDDEIAPLQVIGKSITETELPKLKFGIFDSKILSSDKLLILSKLPGKNVLFGKLVGIIAGPSYSLVRTLNGNLQKLVYILSERQKALGE